MYTQLNTCQRYLGLQPSFLTNLMNAIDTIREQFGTAKTAADISLHDFESELTVPRKTVYSRPEELTKLRWNEMFTCLDEKCRNVFGIIRLILTLPVHSTNCERGFSVMKQVQRPQWSIEGCVVVTSD